MGDEDWQGSRGQKIETCGSQSGFGKKSTCTHQARAAWNSVVADGSSGLMNGCPGVTSTALSMTRCEKNSSVTLVCEHDHVKMSSPVSIHVFIAFGLFNLFPPTSLLIALLFEGRRLSLLLKMIVAGSPQRANGSTLTNVSCLIVRDIKHLEFAAIHCRHLVRVSHNAGARLERVDKSMTRPRTPTKALSY